MVIAQRLMDYFTDLKIDPRTLKKVRNNLELCISAVSRNLKQDIMALHKQDTHKTYLEPLAEIITGMGDGTNSKYLLAYSEIRFTAKDKKFCDAFCIRNDYISFNGKYICGLMRREYGVEGANPKGLSSDLQYYSLAHMDSERKLSCRWDTRDRYYHVKVSDLLDIIKPDMDISHRDYIVSLFQCRQR